MQYHVAYSKKQQQKEKKVKEKKNNKIILKSITNFQVNVYNKITMYDLCAEWMRYTRAQSFP